MTEGMLCKTFHVYACSHQCDCFSFGRMNDSGFFSGPNFMPTIQPTYTQTHTHTNTTANENAMSLGEFHFGIVGIWVVAVYRDLAMDNRFAQFFLMKSQWNHPNAHIKYMQVCVHCVHLGNKRNWNCIHSSKLNESMVKKRFSKKKPSIDQNARFDKHQSSSMLAMEIAI